MAGYGNDWRDFDPNAPRLGHVSGLPMKPRRSKYGAVRTAVDVNLMMYPADGPMPGCVLFDSQREAKRYVDLMLEQRDGKIHGLAVQPRYALTTVGHDGVRREVATYRADFTYVRGGEVVTEDVKGHSTELFKLKRKWMKAEHGIEIQEV